MAAGLDAEPQIASAPRQVHHELRLVAAIHAKGRIAAIQRPVEKLRSVFDDQIAVLRVVTQWPANLPNQIRMHS